MRLRNSSGIESSASATTLTKCSRFILCTLNQESGTLTPSSLRRLRRHHRHVYRRVRLPLHLLPRLAPLEGERRSLPSDQRPQGRDILNVLRSCPNGTPRNSSATIAKMG